MSVLQTIQDIKIPYPTEGMIRTAQLDDTVTPENSVQLAVNMNFDRVGAMQTRPGVTQYADDLVDGINAFGTLRNSIVPPGYEFIFQQGVTQELSTVAFNYPSAVKLSDTKIAVFWQGADGDGFARNFSIDQETGSVTALGTALEFETSANAYNKAIVVSGNIVMNVWQGASSVAMAAGFDCSGESIVAGTPYQFESFGLHFSLALVDSTHVICFFGVNSGAGLADILAIDLGTLAITEPGSTLNYGGSMVRWNSCVRIDGTHFVNNWEDSSNIKAQTFLVNTGTWAITTIGTALTFDTGQVNNLMFIETISGTTYLIDVYRKSSIFLAAQQLAVDMGTFAVTAVGTPYVGPVCTADLAATPMGDGNHWVAFYSSPAGLGHVQMIESDGGHNLTGVGNSPSGYDFGAEFSATALNLALNNVMVVWGGFDSETGKAAMFRPYGDVVNGRWLYASSGDEIFNTNNGTWVGVRGGLATVSKPRFSQYLNYIWMVNGNEQIGGDPIATSDGGSFGTDLVPDNFPQGDFIHAGFEGRVWVANKTLGVIYYTDIVQFVPPTTYILTYNPEVNFITTITPQTGQTMTALYRVPRALLVFTEDTITRIYGATSIDAYPAYNVGTFSQESIIETKTGIFFHHSSGFYQFDYGSQPVEISRRIIDFVKAIPRDYYEDITGVYDGFDNVEWSVGEITVEGVVFANCVLRYTISTQVWTVYDYVGNVIGAMIYFDDGENLNHIMGTAAGKVGAMDTGFTDFGEPFYFEFIDRWRSFTEMYYKQKNISEFSVYSENAAGANFMFQVQKSGPNAWEPIGTVTSDNNSIISNKSEKDFDVMRLRLAGNTQGAQVVVHGIEITTLTIKGQDEN